MFLNENKQTRKRSHERPARRNVLTACAFFAFMLAVVPALSLAALDRDDAPMKSLTSRSRLIFAGRESAVTMSDGMTVLSETEYICGVVAAELPIDSPDEAIKAQAIVCRTLLKYRAQASPEDAGLCQGDMGFLTLTEMKALWGKDFSRNYARLTSLVKSVPGIYLSCRGKPILAAYHRISCGMTENAANVWGVELPCLTPAASRGDCGAEDFATSVRLTGEQFAEICRSELELPEEACAALSIGGMRRSDSGYVISCEICGVTFSGQRIRDAFGLRSACFTLKKKDGEYIFSVRGFGHGVGMSQYGAILMAREGASFREILAHYYPGSELSRPVE